MWRIYVYTLAWVHVHVHVYNLLRRWWRRRAAGLRARRAAGRQSELTETYIQRGSSGSQVKVSRLCGDSLDSVEALETFDSVGSVDSVRYSSRASYIPEHTTRLTCAQLIECAAA